MECTVSIMDLLDAYRRCLCHLEDARFSQTAVSVPDHNCWRLLKLDSSALRLTSAVVSFIFLSTVVVAAVRRMTFVLASAFFCNLVTLDRVNARHSGNAALHRLLSFAGAPPGPDKYIPAAVRICLGASVGVSSVHSELVARFAPKVTSVSKVMQSALDSQHLTPGNAIQASW